MRVLRSFFVLAVILVWAPPSGARSFGRPHDGTGTVNALLGDTSYEERFGQPVPLDVDETLRVRVHLEYVLTNLLQNVPANMPPGMAEARMRTLAHLAEYIRRGEFPRNRGPMPIRRPTFIDDQGRICAVGYLFAVDEGRAAAEEVAAASRYAFLREMHSPRLAAWMAHSGLSLRELEMVQPTYRHEDDAPPPPPVVLFSESGRRGKVVALQFGKYTWAQLATLVERGVSTKNVSSVSVASLEVKTPGVFVTLYAGDNFDGASFTAGANAESRTSKGWVGKVSSVEVSGDARRAAALYETACKGGDVHACSYVDGLRAEADSLDGVIRLHEKSCDEGEPNACFALANILSTNAYGKKDERRAVLLYEKACAAKHLVACAVMGDAYREGSMGVKKDASRAAEFDRRTCDPSPCLEHSPGGSASPTSPEKF